MADLVDTLKKIIKEEKLKTSGLLKAPLKEGTVNMRPPRTQVSPPPQMTRSGHDTSVNPTTVDSVDDNPDVDSVEYPSREQDQRDLRPGFNLYHGVVQTVFTQVHSLGDESGAGEVVRKVTQWALQQMGQDEDTQRVFQSKEQPMNPQVMAAIVQKAMLIILNHVSKEAEKEAIENDVFDVADA